MSDIKKVVEESFARYAGNVILNRAICDARDMLKPSARMLMYSQLNITKNIPCKPFIKSARVVGDALGHYYEHGDSSCYATYMRMAKPYAMRYPLEDCQGNSGTINSTNDEASMRYTELRMSPLGYLLFNDIDKETISEWSENFDETEKYPKISCSKGFYNICNGTVGLGIAMSSSIPQFNLKEINTALIKLLWNPQIDFKEIYCAPDFATGAIILNENEVYESLRAGNGPSIKLRSVIEYDKNKNALTVKELPYGVYTETISKQIQELLEKNPNCGIENINDASHKTPDYEIYLTKYANPNAVLKLLYKETSLENYFGINMTVLVDGKKPAVLGLKEMLQAHLTHEKEVYTRGYQFDLAKIQKRLHIIEGLLKAILMIEEVIRTIKGSSSTAEANMALCKLLDIDNEQAKAILDIKLSRLAHLEIAKLTNEQANLKIEETKINEILSNEMLLKKEIEKGLREVANKFGDDRRTKILNVETEEGQITDEKLYQVSMTNQNNLIITETSSLFTQKRGGVGTKTKLDKGEFVKFSKVCSNNDMLLFFTANGKCVKFQMNSLEFSILDKKTPIAMLCKIEDDDDFTTFVPINFKDKQNEFILFITKNGLIKKSELAEYNFNRGSSINAIKLDAGDKIVSVLFTSKLPVGILTKCGNFIIIDTKEINPIGRMTRGVISIKLNTGDEVVDSQLIGPDTKEFLFVSQGGRAVRNSKNDYTIQGRGGKGIRVRKLDNDVESKFVPLFNEQELIVASEKSTLKLEINTLPLMSRGALGVQTIKLKEKEKISGISKF